MKKLLLLIVTLSALTLADAQPISKQKALMKAQKFLLSNASELTLANNRDEYYVFNDNANGGYIIISGEERMPEVLAYSHDGNFDADNIPCNMRAWLEEYAEQVAYLRMHPEAKVTRRTAPERRNISPLLTCWFNQGRYYNDKCPVINDEHCQTGCVATAMAQILHYFKWPKQTLAVIPAYKTKTYEIDMPAQPITTIDWDNILNQYQDGEEYSEEQINAISTLMLLCGTSIKMDYSPTNSGATFISAKDAFLRYFGFCNTFMTIERNKYEPDEWEQVIYEEVRYRRPVLYSARMGEMGHTFVLDGYENGYFHVNWGWGGAYSYVLMTDVEGWQGLDSGHSAMIGIQADSPNKPLQYAVIDNGKMTLYYDSQMTNRSGVEKWADYKAKVTECVIDSSFADLKLNTLQAMFESFVQMKSIKGLKYLNTVNVKDMSRMFYNCRSLKELDLNELKTDNVTNIAAMFYNCTGLTTLNLSGLNTSNVTNMSQLFGECTGLTSLNLRGFNTERVKDMNCMFYKCRSLKELDLSGLKTDNVTNMAAMFYNCTGLTTLNLSGLNTTNVTSMGSMFYGCSGLTSLDLSRFNTDNVKKMAYMFYDCYGLTSLDLSRFNTSYVTSMSYMFCNCSGLTSLDLSGFNTDNVYDMSFMFNNCSGLTSLDLSGFQTGKVNNMSRMFHNCSGLTSLDLSGFQTDNVKDMSCMFHNCSGLTDLDVSGFQTDNVTNMGDMFSSCKNLTSLDLSNFKTDEVIIISSMFSGDDHLSTIYASDNWNLPKVRSSGGMFKNCTSLVGGAGTTYDGNYIDSTYARIDKGPSAPGYLTYKAPAGIAKVQIVKGIRGIYTLDGKKLAKPQKGLNIIRTDDGKTSKRIVK